MTERSIPSLIHDLLHHAARINTIYAQTESADAFAANETARDAVLWNLVVIGEVCVRLGPEFQAEHHDVPWATIIAQRNIIAHGYDALVWDRIVRVIETDLPIFIKQIETISQQYGPPPQD